MISTRPRLGLLATLAVLLIGGGPAWAESHPVRATLEVMVEGQLVKTSRVFACESYTRTDLGCFLCERWMGTLSHMAEPLPSGGVLLAEFEPYCDGQTGAVIPRDRPRQIAWADKPTRPTRVEGYQTAPPAISDQLAKAPKIIVSTIKFSLGPDDSSTPPSGQDMERTTKWFSTGGGASKQRPIHPYPRIVSGFGLRITPPVAWKRLPWLAERLRTAPDMENLQFTYKENVEISTIDSSRLPVDTIFKDRSDYTYAVPARPSGDDTWALDYDNIGIFISHYLGRRKSRYYSGDHPTDFFEPGDRILPDDWYKRQVIAFEGQNIYASDLYGKFHHGTQSMIKAWSTGHFSEMDPK